MPDIPTPQLLDRRALAPVSLPIAVAAAILIGGGLALRYFSALNDLWLDEIMSFIIATSAESLADIFQQHSDNNHLLNTIFMRAIGKVEWWPAHRLPSIVAGGGTIVLAGLIARRWGVAAMLITMTLMAASYPLVHYGSEARGYSMSAMFALLAFYVLLSFRDRPGPLSFALFWIACGLGLLSHALFLQTLAAFLGWSVFTAMRSEHRWRALLRTILIWHAVPLAMAASLYVLFLRHIIITGGSTIRLTEVLGSTAALVFGAPDSLVSAVLSALGVIMVFGIGIVLLWRRRDDTWAFFILVVLIAPAVILIVTRPEFTYERYFLLPVTFALILLGLVLADLMKRGRVGAAIGGAAMLAILAGNLWHNLRLIQVGRGQYLDATQFMAERTPTGPIQMSSDHDFRNMVMASFYATQLVPPRAVQYRPQDALPPGGTAWYLAHEQNLHRPPEQNLKDARGNTFDLVRTYEYAGLSGWRWFVYRNASQ